MLTEKIKQWRFSHSRKKKSQNFSQRPAIPIPCVIAISTAVGVFASSILVDFFGRQNINELLACLALFTLFGLLGAYWLKNKLSYWLALFLVAGLALGVFHLAFLDYERANLSQTSEFIQLSITEDSKKSAYGSQARAVVASGKHAGKKLLLFLSSSEPLFVGETLTCETKISPPEKEYLSYYDQRGLAGSARISAYQKEANNTWLKPIYELRNYFLNVIGSGTDEQTLNRAILLGERSALFDAGFYHSIKVVGLAHLVAVSGAHLVIVTGFVTLILKRLRVPGKLSVAIQTLFLLLYLVLVGFPVSCIRAAIMSAVALFAIMVHRRASSLTALGFTTLAMTVADPSVVYQLSFQLSVAATFGIVLFMPLFNDWLSALLPRLPDFIRETTAMTLAALVFSQPISAAQFSLVPIISPLANIVATPYLTVLLLAGFTSTFLAPLFPWLLDVLALLTKGLIFILGFMASLPFASIPVSISLGLALSISFVLAIILWAWWPRPNVQHNRIVCSVLACSLVALVLLANVKVSPDQDQIIMLDVGQGDSFVLLSKGRAVMVDTGNKPEMLYDSLARNGITKLDALIITHPDDDHSGSLKSLVGVIAVDRIVVAKGLLEVENNKINSFAREVYEVVGEDRVSTVGRGDKITVGSFVLDVVSPGQLQNEGGNEDSICFYARLDCDSDGSPDWKALFVGDAEAEVLDQLNNEKLLEKVDLYKVGHHGSRKALNPELAQVLSPKISLIGVGKNSYGHPTQETLDTLSSVGSKQYRSDLSGDVVCTFNATSLEVSTERKGSSGG